MKKRITKGEYNLAEETKKREGKYVLWEIIQIISNKLVPWPAVKSAKIIEICKNISIQRGRRTAEVFFWLSYRHYHKWCLGSSQAEILTLWRRRSFGEIRRLSWAKYHTQPFLDKRMSWPSAQEKEQNGLGNFFRTLTSEICHLQLGTPFHKRPAVLELGSLEKVASRSHHLQFHHSLPAASLGANLKRPSVCSMIKTRNSARAQFISSSPKLVRIFVHVGYFILNICCCSMSVALLALSFDLFLIVAFIACIRSRSTTWDKNRNKQTNKPIIFNNLVI